VAGDGAPFCYFKSNDPSQDNSSTFGLSPTTTSLAAMPPPECSIMGPSRVDCGFDRITPEECSAKGCCYYHTSNIGAPFCFYKSAVVGTTVTTTTPKTSSSTAVLPPTSPAAPSVAGDGAPFCYYPRAPKTTVAATVKAVLKDCSITGPDRVDCGYDGITPAKCSKKGCCYYTSSSNPPTSTTLIPATTQQQATDSQNEVLGSNGNSVNVLANNKFQPGGMMLIATLTAVAATAVLCLAYIMCFRSPRELDNNTNMEENQRLYDPVPEPTRCSQALPGSEAYQQYHRLFVQRWSTKLWPTAAGRDVPPPRIRAIYELDGEPHINAYKHKQRDLDRQPGPKQGSQPGNEKTRFHGARCKCLFEGTPCRDATCSVCRIVEQGNFTKDSIDGEMFFTAGSHSAKGHGLAPGKNPPPKNLEHFVDDDAGNAVFVANVLLGTPQFVTEKTKGRLPAGNHSRIADPSTGVDEIIILDEAQALPRALILFG